MQPVIKITNLVKKFGHNYALRNVTMDIWPRQFVAIIGPNGAGKTTLIRTLATLIRPSAGTVQIAGLDLLKQGDKIRRLVGIIGHQTFLYEELSARENLEFYGRMYHVNNLDQQIDTLLQKVGLAHRADDHVRHFSRGMLQRLSIARALVHEPEILLLDEPYTGLDQNAADMLTAMLRSLVGTDHTILMVTHNVAQALELCDQVAILVNGRLVLNQAVAELDLTSFRVQYDELVGAGGGLRV